MADSDSLDFAGKVEYSIEIDDTVSGIPITDTTFTLYDSIYQLYPKARMTINDTIGFYNEYMAFVNGTKVKLSYGQTKDTWQTCTYRVVQNSVPEQNNSSRWGGTFDLSLVHDFIYGQTLTSKAYDSNISDIITDIAGAYEFDSTDIDTTLNSDKWYQPYVTDADFMMNYLLPFAYSTDCGDSPFFCFIDSNNGFHFKNFSSLMTQNPEQTFYFKSKGLEFSIEDDVIVTLSFAQSSVEETKPFYRRIISKYDEKGAFAKNDVDSMLTDYPNNEQNPIPVKLDDECVTGILKVFDDDVNSDSGKNNNKGLEINGNRHSIFTDRIIITVPFNRNICAGKVVSVNLPSLTGSSDTAELSLRYSGNYIVESSYQKWDGRQSTTILVCGKQSVKLTSDYRNLALIANR